MDAICRGLRRLQPQPEAATPNEFVRGRRFVEDSVSTIVQIARRRVEESPNAIAFQESTPAPDSGWKPWSWSDYWRRVQETAGAFVAADLTRGDRVAILAGTSLAWEIADKAVLTAGGVVVGIDAHATPDQIRFVLAHSESRGLVTTSKDLARLEPGLVEPFKFILLLDDDPVNVPASVPAFRFNRLPKSNKPVLPEIQPEDEATLVYTSGTTGTPKGILYRHRQVVEACQAIASFFPEARQAEARIICWLPLSSLFQRMLNLLSITNGLTTYFVTDPREIVNAARGIKPHFFIGVPRFYEKAYQEIQKGLTSVTGWQSALIHRAIDLGRRRSRAAQTGEKMGMSDRVLSPLLDRIVLGPLRRRFIGDSVRILFTGSAPMAPEIMEFFHAIGLPLLEGYAMSENIVPMAMNRLARFRIGAVGLPLSLNEIRMGDENELQVKGPGVFSGYYKSDAAENRFTADGFFKTGDSGRIDDEGFLWLTGRTSEILKTSTGRRISPLAIEAALRSSPYIDQAVVFGHGRRHLAALITVQAERVEKELADRGLKFETKEALTASTAAHSLLEPEIERLTKQFPAYEQVRVFAIAPRAFDIPSGELTSSLKLRRNVIEKNYAHLLEPLFSQAAAGV